MMVERSKLERVVGVVEPFESQSSLHKRPNTRSSRALENSCEDDEEAEKEAGKKEGVIKATIKLIDDPGQPEKITLEEEILENSIDLKRKAAEGGDFQSRRLRRRG